MYIVGAWVTLQVADLAFESWDISSSALRHIWVGAILGFPIALIFGWRYDITTRGIVRTPAADAGEEIDLSLHRKDYVVLALLLLVAASVVYQLSVKISDTPPDEIPQTGKHDPVSTSIAVLPLENLSGEPEQAYFVNGIHDALISGLSRISGLHVTSKISTWTYANSTKPHETICSELVISKIIKGSVLRVENDVQVNVQLYDCTGGKPEWSASYDRKLSDVLIMQSDITRSVAEAVEVVLTRKESELLARTRTVNPAAYETYLRGMFHLEMITARDMQRAEGLFTRALKFDGESALAHWGLGRACRFQMQFGMGLPTERDPECRGHQFKALAIDPDLPQVHLGLALSYWLYDYDWNAAETSFRRALDLNPNYAEAYMFYSHFLANMLRWEESEWNILRAIELDPLNPFVLGLRGAQLHLTGRYMQAVEMLNRIHTDVPGFGFGFDVLWHSNFRLGNLDAALEAAKKHYAITMGIPEVVEKIEQVYAEHGYDRAMREVGEKLEALAAERYIQAVFIAVPFAMTGDAVKTAKWLDKGFEQRDPQMPYVSTLGSLFVVADDQRYQEIMAKMNLASPVPTNEL
jgi:TolB-like protein/tetratricopeptide (TPR) repeat protein